MKKLINNTISVLFTLTLIAGIYMRLHQFFMGRSLWEDEAHFAVNFVTHSYLGLLQPLDYVQAAPVLYLLTVKTFALLFGYNEFAFRALPLILSILTLPLFYLIIDALTKSKLAALIGLFVFSVNLSIIYFSSELKPYGVDVCVYLILVYTAITSHPYISRNRHLLLALIGSLAMLYSNASFMILFCVFCYMLYNWYNERKINKADIKVIATWAIVFLSNYFLFIYHHPSAAQQKYNYAADFCPVNIFSPQFAAFFKTRYNDLFFDLMLYISKSFGFIYIAPLILIIAVAYAIYKKQYAILIFTCLPVLVHLVLSALKIYPFVYRLILYLVPAFIILMTYGTYIIAAFLAKRLHFVLGGLFILFCCYSFTLPSFQQYPLWFREVKPSLDYMNKYYPHADIYVTTPYTLYKYYNLVGYAKDSMYEGIEWNITPKQYYELVEDEPANYILFHATDSTVDGYKDVMNDLRQKKLIVKECSYKTYTVSEIKPLHPHARDTNFRVLDHRNLTGNNALDPNGEHVLALWSNEPMTVATNLPAGYYKVTILSKGTPLGGIYPHLDVYANSDSVGNFYTQGDYAGTDFYFYQKQSRTATITIHMDNDAQDLKKKEDRNAFIHKIYINKAAVVH